MSTISHTLKDVLENKGVVLVSLHSGDPGEEGSTPINELSYEGYKRARAFFDFSTSSSELKARNKERIDFPAAAPSAPGGCSHANISPDKNGIPVKFDKITHVALLDGDGMILRAGALAHPLQMAHNVAPRFEPGRMTVNVPEDWND